MAAAVNTPTTEAGEKLIQAIGTITMSGSYTTGGDTLDFVGKIHTGRAPEFVEIIGESGFLYRWVKGTTLANGKIKVMQGDNDNGSDGPAVEVASGALPAGVTGDVVRYKATYRQSI